MHRCFLCPGSLHETTVYFPEAPRTWACDQCRKVFLPCVVCRQISGEWNQSAVVCGNPACTRQGQTLQQCGRCRLWSMTFSAHDPAQTAICCNPQCELATHTDPTTSFPHPDDTYPPCPPAPSTPTAESSTVDALLDRIAKQSHFEERYEIGPLLAQGGMGEIFQAHDKILRRQVAVKMMRAHHHDESLRGQFLKEARVGGRLLHPHILAVFDLGVNHAGHIYYTMRLVDGASLHGCLTALNQSAVTKLVAYPLRRIVEAFVGACQGVDYAHQNRVLHLDLKPQNILVSGFKEVFVIDWGLARVDDEDDTEQLADLYRSASPSLTGNHTGVLGERVVGTPGYMAPEQCRGDVLQFGPATDVYGLGGILYFILYGGAPNQGNHLADVMANAGLAKRKGKLRSGIWPQGHRMPREVQEALGQLEEICLKALEPRVEHRLASAEALIIELNEWLARTAALGI